MKCKTLAMIFVLTICIVLTACGEAKRPIDYPNTTWVCETAGITFSVSEDGKIENATMPDKDGNLLQISFIFSDISEGTVSITNPDGSEIYVSGTCNYDSDIFSIIVTDIFNPDLNIPATRLTFERA